MIIIQRLFSERTEKKEKREKRAKIRAKASLILGVPTLPTVPKIYKTVVDKNRKRLVDELVKRIKNRPRTLEKLTENPEEAKKALNKIVNDSKQLKRAKVKGAILSAIPVALTASGLYGLRKSIKNKSGQIIDDINNKRQRYKPDIE